MCDGHRFAQIETWPGGGNWDLWETSYVGVGVASGFSSFSWAKEVLVIAFQVIESYPSLTRKARKEVLDGLVCLLEPDVNRGH